MSKFPPAETNNVDGLELFLDDHRISWQYNVTRELNQPTRYEGNPILQLENPWEQSFVQMYGNVLPRAEGGYRMWYNAGAKGEQADKALCYAESEDGFSWDRVMSDNHPYHGHTPTNIVIGPQPHTAGPCVIENQHNEDPESRLLLMFNSYPRFYPQYEQMMQGSRWCFVATSPDGLNWHPPEGRPAISGKADCGQSIVWDPIKRRYMAYLRGTRTFEPHYDAFTSPWGETVRVRYVRLSVSEDFEHWSEPVELMRADERDGDPFNHMHQLAVTRMGNQYVGLLGMFPIEEFRDIPGKNILMEDGPIDMQLTVSRDGLHWSRVANRQTFLPMGLPGTWDANWLVVMHNIVLTDDQMRFYYNATAVKRSDRPAYNPKTSKDIRTRIGVATLPLHRFQKLRPTRLNQPAIIETKPLYMHEGDLLVNADASLGQIQVELTDFNGNTIEGFSKEDCHPIETDQLKHIVRWGAAGDTKRRICDAIDHDLAFRRALRVRFYLNQSHLFAANFPCSDPIG